MAKIRVRARAVDMLGRQQIAGIPTAIHELFKNAHDAYADHVEVDYFRAEGSFLLRDDGVGMSREEFEQRWLTLGTESKVGGRSPVKRPYQDPHKPIRPVLGEKGIGRLAIALIGSQMLILSRAERADGLQDLVVSFIHWGLFEIPGIDLDQIAIPVETVPGGTLPDKKFISGLLAQVKNNVIQLAGHMVEAIYEKIMHEINMFDIDPLAVDGALGGLSLAGDGRGTHFFILPADPILENDIEDIRDNVAAPLQRMLLGFSNTMMPDSPPPLIKAAFRDHRKDGTAHELIGEKIFFTPDEFIAADHHFHGEFDQYGQFCGTVGIYGEEPVEYTIHWDGAQGMETACGAFKINLAYVQGICIESKLPPEDHARMIAKLYLIGGLYIYRDGIRILPYGNYDHDFLNIERRRTKSAADWYFSYRRMLGAVEINSQKNPQLVEKAGREGFRQNKAYRQFSSILENFFVRLAIDFFRKEAVYGENYNRIREELQNQYEVLKKRAKSVRERRAKFDATLDAFFSKIENGDHIVEADQIRSDVISALESISLLKEPEDAAKELLGLESRMRKRLVKFRINYTVTKPSGIGLTKQQRSDWDACCQNLDRINKEVFQPLESDINKRISKLINEAKLAFDRRRRIDQALVDIQGQSLRNAKVRGKEAREKSATLSEQVVTETRQRITRVDRVIQQTLAEFAGTDTDGLSDEQMLSLQQDLGHKIVSVAEEEVKFLESIRDQLQTLSDALKKNESLNEMTAAMEEHSEYLKGQLDLYSDLAQAGTAVGIVKHEFSSTIHKVRKNIMQLREWAASNSELGEIYRGIRTSFEHLDGYLTLFTPLSRRLQRQRIPINGGEIRKYLRSLYGERMSRHGIKLTSTEAFDDKSVFGFPSTFYPCFVNIVDNAIYWLTKNSEGGSINWKGPKKISLDADENCFLISNSGPGIELRDAEGIFDFTFSRKKFGRGMGLYISRETLRREGFDLVLENAGTNMHPTFRIITTTDDNSDNSDKGED